ncbi:MAG: YtxH domain-containing protein [Coriobacteriales bacterium]|nr:YtxH domain-containing protein [Coriobacteriales bacterium]
MSNSSGFLGFIAGSIFGAAIGAVAGVFLAPRAGSETRAMAADAAADAWGNVVDVYQQSASDVAAKVDNAFEDTYDKTEEFRAKIETARERMDQIRTSLANNVAQAVDSIKADVEDVVPQEVEIEAEAEEPAQTEPTSWTVHI